MRVTAEAFLFAGLAEDDVLDPDVAVAHMEHLASTLKGLSESERQEFRHFVGAMATEEHSAHGPSARVRFLESLIDNIGLN